MPLFEVELDDGRIFDIEADRQPTNEEIQSALQPYQSMQNLAGATAAGAAQGLLSVPSGAIGGVGALGEIAGFDNNSFQRAGDAIEEFGREQFPISPNFENSSLPEVAGAIGQAGGQLLTLPVGGVAGKLIGGAAGAVRGAQVAGLGSGALMGADAGQDTADRLGIENRAQRAALILGQAGIELGTEMLGGFGSKQFTEGILGRVADMPWRNPSFLSTALAEGGEEVIAGTAQPFLERGVLLGQDAPSGVELTGIPLTSVDATLDVLKQGALGAVAGGFMGGVNSFLNRPEPKAVLDWRLRAKARINELSSAPQLTEEEQSELNQLQTEDQNATEWLQNYGESNIYEPLRQVVDPVSDWRNQRESLIADTEDEAGKQELRRQTNEEIEAATEILERGGNPFSPEVSTAALDEALSPPDPVTETAIRAASNDPVVVETKAVADEVDAAGAPATATVLKEQADLKAAENVVAIEQEQLNLLQQDEQTTPITERARSTAEAQQATPQVEEGRPISNQELGMVDAQSQLDAGTGGILDAGRPAIQVPGEGDAAGLSEVAGEVASTAGQVGASTVRNERQIPTGIQIDETQTTLTENDGQPIPSGASSQDQPIQGEAFSTFESGNAGASSEANRIREGVQGEGGSTSQRDGSSGLQEQSIPTVDASVAFESALRNESKDLPKWTDERVAEAVEWFRNGKQGDPPWGKPVVSRAVLAVDSQARSDWNKKEQELLRRFKRADVQDQADVDDVQAKQAIERERQSYFEIPSEELSLSVPFQAADGMSNGELAREIRNVKADFQSFKEAFREELSSFQNNYRELSSTVGAQAAWRELEQSNPAGAELYDRYLNRAVNLSRLEAQLEQRGLNPDEPIPEGLEDFVPKVQKERNKPLKKGVANSIQDTWAEISKSEDSFRGKKSTAKDPNSLAQEMSGGKVRGYLDADGDVVFRSPNGGQLSIVDPESSRPTIWALSADSEGKAQGGGSQLYQIAFAWAHNNGKKIFPSNNLTSINAYVRRTSNMLSSALRYGSTKHLLPDADQRISGWKNGDDKGNIARLAWRESQQVLKAIPQAANIRYDFQTGDFYTQTPQEGAVAQGQAEDAARPSEATNTSTGRVNLSPQDLEAIVTESLDGGYANELGIGETTLKRAIITNTAAQEQASGSVAAPQGILYSQQEGEDAGATLEDAQKGLQELRATELGILMANDVVIVQSLPELREVTANRPFSEEVYGLLNRAEGFFRPSTGESYVILDRVKRLNGESYSDAVKRIIFHERAFHGGFKWMYQNDPSFARQAMDVVRMIPKAERDALRDYPGIGDSDIAMLEEWLARKLQQEDPNELAQRDPLFKRIWQAIKDLVARVLGKPVTSEYVDREARRLVGEILRNREAFGNQAMSADEDIVAQRDVDTSTRFSIPFSQKDADSSAAQIRQEAGFHADAPSSMLGLHTFMGNKTDQAYVVQTIRPQADFVRARIWKGGVDEDGHPLVNEENTRNFWRENDRMSSDVNWTRSMQEDFREMASQSTEAQLRANKAEAIGDIAQLELSNYAQLMAASGASDAMEAVDAIKRARFYNDVTQLMYTSIAGKARSMNARAQAARNGMMGFWNGLNMLEDKNEKAVSTTVGKGNVKKIQEAVNNPQDQDIDTDGVEDPTEGLTEDERLGNARDNEAQKIIDKIDESRTEWLGPPKNRSKIQALKREALASELTDTSRPGHLTRDGFVRRYTQAFEALGVSRPIAINLSSRLYDENMRMRTDAFMRQMDSKVKNAGVNQLAKDLLADPLNVLGDPALMKERMIEWLKGAGLTEEQASRWAKRHEKTFREKLIKAKEKALDRAIKGVKTITTPSVERIRQAIRAGALDPVDGVRNAIAEALGASSLTAQELSELAAADLRMRDGSPTEQQIALSKIRDILQRKMPDTTTGQRILQAYIQSVLSGLSTQSLGFTVPLFTNMTRLGLGLGETMIAATRGILPKNEVPSAIMASMNDYVDAYKSYVSAFANIWKNDITTIHHQENLNLINSLREDLRRQLDKFKNGTPAQKLKAIIPIAQSSTDIVRRVMNASDGAALAVFRQVFTRQGARKIFGSGPNRLTTAQIGLVFQEAQDAGKQAAEEAFSRKGYSESESQQIGFDKMNEFIYEFVTANYSATDANQLRDFAEKETAYELGIKPPSGGSEKVPAGDIFAHVAAMIQSASNYMSRESPLLGRMLLGFVSIPTALANRSLHYTPYGLARYFWKARELGRGNDELYMNSMGSDLQRRQRYVEGVAGTTAMLLLSMLAFLGNGDDEDYTGLRVTGSGPKDPALRDAWLKTGQKPNSFSWMVNGKVVASVPFGRGGFESIKLAAVGVAALDDMRLNNELSNGTALDHAGDWVKSSLVAGLESTSYFGLKSIANAVALGDSRASEASVASQGAWTTSGLVPWSGLIKSVSRPFIGQLDVSSAEAAVVAQFPVLNAIYGQKARNFLGDVKGSEPVDLFTKASDRLFLSGLPIYLAIDPSAANGKAYELFISKGNAPSVPSRSRLTSEFGGVTDSQWSRYLIARGNFIKKEVFSQYNKLKALDRAAFGDALSAISTAATREAKRSVFGNK